MTEENGKVISLDGKKKKEVTIDTSAIGSDLTDEQDKKVNTRRNKDGWNQRKLYEVMLLEEIPETQRPNEPTHAVLEGELGKWDVDGQSNYSVRNQALIHYIADLANSNGADDTFDYGFVESLLRNGADINCMDPTGQNMFHEVARSWNTDVAKFLVENGANVNHQDEYGRSPLHVAAAVDYADMVEFILQNGGDIDIKTNGEEQTAMHYAAKNDAVNSIQMLLGYGADINARDSRNRTPLQVAAEMNRFKAAKLLVTEGAPAGVYDSHGNSALSLLIEKIPEVALIALDQLHTTDYINRREFYFLNHLEGAKLKEELQDTPARSPLEIAVQNQRFDIIMHPVMHRLIAVKWKIYGKTGAILDLVLNLIYTILWTVESVTIPKNGHELYTPLRENIWRLAMNGFIILFTLMEIKRQVIQMIYARRAMVKWREWRVEQLQQDKQYCHPRWPQESKYLDSEIHALKGLHFVSSSDNWIYFDWICLFTILAAITTNVLFHHQEEIIWKEINNHTAALMLLILWLRMFKYARPFENAGPFVVIFSNVVGDILKWFVLNAIIVIPFTCGFWIEFGKNALHPAEGYTDVSSLIYNIFQMMIIGDYGLQNLVAANKTLARIMCLSFILVVGIITLNLLIALVSNTFERHYENAVANAVMQRASTILMLQSRMAKKKRRSFYEFIKNNASPQIIVQSKYGRLMTGAAEDRAGIERVYDDIREIKSVLAERFGRSYGKENKSDLEVVLEDLGKVKRSGKELAKDIKNVKLILYGIGGQPVSPVYKESRMSSTEVPRNHKDDDDDSDQGNTKNKNKDTKNNDNNNNNDSINNNIHKNNNNKNNSNNNSNNDDNNNNNNNSIGNIAPYPTEFPSLPNVEMPPVPLGFDNLFRPRKTRKRNQSRRSKKPTSSTSESSDYEGANMMAGLPGPQVSLHRPRYYAEHAGSPMKRNGENYYHFSPREYPGEPTRSGVSPSSERRYMEPQQGERHTPTHMYPGDRGSNVLPIYQITPATPYHPDMSPTPPGRSEYPRRWSGQQPAQPVASVYQQPSGPPSMRFAHEYVPQPDDVSDHHGYRRLSRATLSPPEVQRGYQGHESDILKQTESNQPRRTSRSETPSRPNTTPQVRIAHGEERKDDGNVSNKRDSASSETPNLEQSRNVNAPVNPESNW